MAHKSGAEFEQFYLEQRRLARKQHRRERRQQEQKRFNDQCREFRVNEDQKRRKVFRLLLERESIVRAARQPILDARREAARTRARQINNIRSNYTRRKSGASLTHHRDRLAAHLFGAFCKQLAGGSCYWCGILCTSLTLEHLHPLSRGGTHSIQNVQASCQPCNSRKCCKTPDEYIEWLSERGITAAFDSSVKDHWVAVGCP